MIALRGVRFGYAGDQAAIVCEALEIGGGLTLLLGTNGAGKSTLLKLAAGIERPAEGVVEIDGVDLWDEEARARAALAYVPEHPDLSPYATLGEVLRLVARLRGGPPESGERALDRAGLDGLGDRTVRELSMGQRRRAMLAAAFIGEPSTLLLDEPLEAMDRGMRETIVAWLDRVARGGATVVVATHDVAPFAATAARAIVMERGIPRLIAELPPDPTERLALLDACARR